MEQQFLDNSIDEESLSTKKILCVLATIFPLFCWVPYIYDSKSQFCRHFSNQILLMFIIDILFSIIISIISLFTSTVSLIPMLFSHGDFSILTASLPFIITMFLSLFFNIFMFICKVLNIVNIINVQYNNLPLFGKIRIIK